LNVTFPGESAENRAARDRLLAQEILFDLTPEGRPGDWDEQLSYS
jgi:hypothetical protein